MHRLVNPWRLVSLVAIVGFILASGGQMAGAQSPRPDTPGFETPGDREFASGEILVKTEESASPERLAEINRANGAEIEDRLPGIGVSEVDLPRDLPVEQAVRRYENAPGIEYAEPNFKLYASDFIPNDPRYPNLYGLDNTGQTGGASGADIDAPEAWDLETGNQKTIIAVIDTGVNTGHPDLRDNIWTNGDEKNNGNDNDDNGYKGDVRGWDFYNDDNTVYDSGDGDKHGTHVAGIIAARGNNDRGVTGINHRARIMPLKFLGPNGGFTSDAIAALDYAVDNGATISNNSWGGGARSSALKDALNRAEAEGHLFVAAAGNADNDNDANPSYPASYDNPNIISVAATDDEDRLAGFSNYGGNSVDLGAPGVSILSTVPGGYASYSGTSMATPHVAGVAGLLKSQKPSRGFKGLKPLIMGAAENRPALKDRTVTGGRLNAAGAVGVTLTRATLSSGRSPVLIGQGTGLSGKLASSDGRALGGEKVVLQQRPVGARGFSRLAVLTTASNGTFRKTGVKPSKHTVYRVRYVGNRAKRYDSTLSPSRRVNVRVRVPLRVNQSNLRLGNRRGIYGRVIPAHAGKKVKLVIKRNGSVIERETLKLNRYSKYRHVYKPPRLGRYTVSVLFPRDVDHLGNRSPQKKFKVIR